MQETITRRARIGVFELDLGAGELRNKGCRVVLQEQPLRILRMLMIRPGKLVVREDIRKELWPHDTVVEFDQGINTAIRKLREAFRDSAEKPKYIETVTRRGYRLIAPVEWLESSPASPPPEPLVPLASLIGRKVSHYRVLEVLGGGGMGVIYKAEDLKLGRRVALKFLPEELAGDPAALERFEREARAASALEHPNICPVYEFGEHEGQPFIAMQFLSGQTLRDRLEAAARAPISVSELFDLAIQIAAGLDAAHSQGIIHRDIKPANIFITTQGEVKILDFGLAKLTAESGTDILSAGRADARFEVHRQDACATARKTPALPLTRTGVAMGTAPYMSPEQVRGEKLDNRTDLFSFGLVLYETATGQAAFAGGTVAEVHDAIVNRTPAPARELNPDIPPRLEGIITRALEKDRGLRYQTAAELQAELRDLKRETDSGRAMAAAQIPSAARMRSLLILGVPALALVAVAGAAWFWARYRGAQPEGSERQITANPSEDWVMAGAISPDGQRIAYNDLTGVNVRFTDSGETHALSLPEGFQDRIADIEWFPDGEKLLVDVYQGTDAELWVIDLVGKTAPHLLHANAAWPAISPDGRLVAFVRGEGERKLSVWVGGTDGEAPRKLTQEDNQTASPAWSPDGRWIAYASWNDADPVPIPDIEVRPSGGGRAKILVSGSRFPQSNSLCIPVTHCLQWAPDWRLVFSTRQVLGSPSGQESFSLWAVGVKSPAVEAAGEPERLAHWNDFAPQDLTLTANGKRLSFLKTRQWQDVYWCELGPDAYRMKPPHRFTLDNRGIESLDSWSRDSQAIFFSSHRNGKPEIFRQGLNQGIGETFAQGSGDRCCLELSSDGTWILYEDWSPTTGGMPPSPRRLICQPAAGGSPEVVLEEPQGALWDYQCPLESGSPCVLRQTQGNEFAFYALDPVRGRGEQLGKITAPHSDWFSGFSISPDGSRLAVVRGVDEYQGRIDVLTFRDRAWQRVPVDTSWGLLQSVAWAADGKSFFVTANLSGSKNLLHVTLDGGARSLLHFDRRQFMSNPLPSPNGKYLAFQATTWDSNVWMLENF